MIVQSGPEGQTRHFVIKLEEHLELVGQLAENFGNDEFQAPEPREEFLYVCRWHDRGWRNLDDNPPLDPKTGLPYNLGETPLPVIMLTSSSSPEHNEARHPYCGLIDSMHIWGLYKGRYGFSDKVLLDAIPDEHRAMVDCMLSLEYQRQTRLKTELAADPETAPWVEEKRLFTNYKLLQLFDTMALYFNCTHEAGRGESTFNHVPRDLSNDVDVRIRPEGDKNYSVSPYPFRESPVEVSFQGRFLTPWSAGETPDMAAAMRDTPVERQTAILADA